MCIKKNHVQLLQVKVEITYMLVFLPKLNCLHFSPSQVAAWLWPPKLLFLLLIVCLHQTPPIIPVLLLQVISGARFPR